MIVRKKTVRDMDWIEREGNGGVINEVVTTTWYLLFIPVYTNVFVYNNKGNYAKEDKPKGISIGNR